MSEPVIVVETNVADGARPRLDVITIPFQDGIVLLDRRRDRVTACNASATLIWRALQSGASPSDAAAALADTYDLPRDRAKRDVAAILASWAAEGLLSGTAHSTDPTHDDHPILDDTVAARVPSGPVVPRYYAIGAATFRLRIADTATADRLAPLLRPFQADPCDAAICLDVTPDGDAFVLTEGTTERLRTALAEEQAGGVLHAMLETVHRDTPWLCLIHGAAVTRNGAAILLPGRSGSGKSTLAASLIARGFDCFGDDLIALRAPDGAVMPWRLPISIKAGSWNALTPLFPQLAEAPVHHAGKGAMKFLVQGPARDDRPTPTRALVFPTFDPDSGGSIRPLSSLESLERLMVDRIWLGHPIAEPTLAAFLRWLEHTPAFAITYRDLAGAWDYIDSITASEASDPPTTGAGAGARA